MSLSPQAGEPRIINNHSNTIITFFPCINYVQSCQRWYWLRRGLGYLAGCLLLTHSRMVALQCCKWSDFGPAKPIHNSRSAALNVCPCVLVDVPSTSFRQILSIPSAVSKSSLVIGLHHTVHAKVPYCMLWLMDINGRRNFRGCAISAFSWCLLSKPSTGQRPVEAELLAAQTVHPLQRKAGFPCVLVSLGGVGVGIGICSNYHGLCRSLQTKLKPNACIQDVFFQHIHFHSCV